MDVFVIEDHEGNTTTVPATQDTLDSLNIKMDVNKFKDGSIRKLLQFQTRINE